MNSLFIMTGEHSGDNIAAWYLNQIDRTQYTRIEAVGGESLKNAGIKLFDRIENYSFVGLVEIIRHLPFIFRSLSRITRYIVEEQFDTVVLVDFPGFNLRLLKRLKKANPQLKVIYVSPPQLWAWGSGRITLLKELCDEVVVMYPFEVAWYAERGVTATYMGSPVAEAVAPYLIESEHKIDQIALLPGSRMSEIKRLLPIMLDAVRRFKRMHSRVKIILPLAESISATALELELKRAGFQDWGRDVVIVQGHEAKMKALARCCFAVTKTGTNTLELALLKVPSIAVYKVGFITYWVAWMVVKIKYIALPNIFTGKELFPEFIQRRCTSELIFQALKAGYESWLRNEDRYHETVRQLDTLRKTFDLPYGKN